MPVNIEYVDEQLREKQQFKSDHLALFYFVGSYCPLLVTADITVLCIISYYCNWEGDLKTPEEGSKVRDHIRATWSYTHRGCY